MKKIIAIAAAVLLVAGAVVIGRLSAIPKQNDSNPFVLDTAGVLSAETEAYILSLNEQSEKGRVYVAAVKSTNKHSLSKFTKKLKKAWKINDGTDALLIVVPSKGEFNGFWGSELDDRESQIKKVYDGAVRTAVIKKDYDTAAKAFCDAAFGVQESVMSGEASTYTPAEQLGNKFASVIESIVNGIVNVVVFILEKIWKIIRKLWIPLAVIIVIVLLSKKGK